MSFVADAQQAMVRYEQRVAHPPQRVTFGRCQRRANRVSCWVREEYDYADATDGTPVVLDFDVKLRAIKTPKGWRVQEL